MFLLLTHPICIIHVGSAIKGVYCCIFFPILRTPLYSSLQLNILLLPSPFLFLPPSFITLSLSIPITSPFFLPAATYIRSTVLPSILSYQFHVSLLCACLSLSPPTSHYSLSFDPTD